MLKLNLFIFIIMWLIMMLMIFLIINKLIHPIIIMIFMIIFNISICLNMSIWKMNYMYAIMTFLIMISGLMIIFMYFSSLISNEQLTINLNFNFLLLLFINSLMLFLFMNKMMILNQFFYSMFESNPLNLMLINKFMNIMNLYYFPSNNLTLMTIFFILISFISIIKINSSSYSLSMRKISKYESI